MKAKNLVLCAVLISLAMTLSYMERFIPLNLAVPLPGVKPGLANIVTMLALYFLNGKMTFTIVVIRCFLGSLFGGGLTGFAMSVTGGVTAFAAMSCAKRIPFLSIYGVSILGAAAHNFGQVCAASVLMQSPFTFIYLGFLLIVAIVSGLITGTVSAATLRTLSAAGWKHLSGGHKLCLKRS